MAFKPFKPPSLKTANQNAPATDRQFAEQPRKRVKLSPDVLNEPDSRNVTLPSQVKREPLQVLRNIPSPEVELRKFDNGLRYYSVLWRKFTLKKNKTWDDDGVLSFQNGQLNLHDSKGRHLGSLSQQKQVVVGSILSMCGREVEIDAEISKTEFDMIVRKQAKSPKPIVSLSQASNDASIIEPSCPKPQSKPSLQEQMRAQIRKEKTSSDVNKRGVSSGPTGKRGSAFKQPLKDNNVLLQVPSETPIPRHDPSAPGAIVFKQPQRCPAGKQLVDVVLDPLLTKHLREHQIEGIKFLYECVMDMRNFSGQGCILADDMGLGKTLQTIALLWTLIKQNPVYKAEPVVKKALIVCPVTLVENWKNEFRKWLGRDRLGVMTFGDKGSRLSMFDGKNFKVMIVGYERLRTIAEDLTRGSGIDIIVCDEGHRLKTLQNKSAKAIETLNTSKRIILSGTPIQNDLSEFFAMANFVNDGIFGTYKSFVRDFEKPIMKSRQPDATENDIERGTDASKELAGLTSPFILRRTADILSHYLPPKTEYVLFCQPTAEQASVYKNVLKTPMFQNALGSNEAALQMITILKKLCNSPSLMRPLQGSDESTASNSLQTLNEMLPYNVSKLYQNSFSSKIRLLDELLQQVRTSTDDKVVLVSNYTATLNLMENLCVSSGMTYRRLDGSVSNAKRQVMVDEFNRASPTTCFAFLLSAKAGGVGINLIGGNRLILFDVDWNPATDDQAMARIHREGQRKPCKIYRFLIKGGLEERIWQRQVVKRGLAESIMETGSKGVATMDVPKGKGKKGQAAFSKEELRDLFRLDERQGLQTHDLINCSCDGKGTMSNNERKKTPEMTISPNVHDIDNLISPYIEGRNPALPEANTFVKASALTDECLDDYEDRISTKIRPHRARRKRGGGSVGDDDESSEDMHELMTYMHIDTSGIQCIDRHDNNDDTDELARINELIEDDCLMHVLKLDRDVVAGNIQYVFKKKSMVQGKTDLGENFEE